MRRIYTLFFLGLSLFACTTDNAPKTKSEILVSKVWMIQEVNATGFLTGQVFLRGRTPEGSTYDVSKVRLSFNANGTATAIDPSGNNTARGNWKLSNGDTKLEISNTGNYLLDGSATVITITSSEFSFTGNKTYKGEPTTAVVKLVPAP